MTASVNGVIPFVVEDDTYYLQFDINALCTLEQRFDTDIKSLLDKLSSETIRVGTLRTIFWAGLQGRHPNVSEAKAGDLISALGVVEVHKLFERGLSSSFPEEEANAAGGPQRAA